MLSDGRERRIHHTHTHTNMASPSSDTEMNDLSPLPMHNHQPEALFNFWWYGKFDSKIFVLFLFYDFWHTHTWIKTHHSARFPITAWTPPTPTEYTHLSICQEANRELHLSYLLLTKWIILKEPSFPEKKEGESGMRSKVVLVFGLLEQVASPDVISRRERSCLTGNHQL